MLESLDGYYIMLPFPIIIEILMLEAWKTRFEIPNLDTWHYTCFANYNFHDVKGHLLIIHESHVYVDSLSLLKLWRTYSFVITQPYQNYLSS